MQHGAVLLCWILLAACVSPAGIPRGVAAVDDRLYFGRSMSGGREVGEEEWAGFMRNDVTPRFPDGLTWWAANGQWRDHRDSIVTERSFVIEVIHADEAAADRRIEEVIDAYRLRFHQESVLWLRAGAAVRF